MKNKLQVYLLALICFVSSEACKNNNTKAAAKQSIGAILALPNDASGSTKPTQKRKTTIEQTGLIRHEIPVLCYHQVRNWNAADSKNAKTYIIPPTRFKEHMKLLADSGYNSILPEDLPAFITNNKKPSAKPIIVTFDDGTEGQYVDALPVLNKYGFKAAFFIMTVTLNKPNYMTKEQVYDLSKQGHVIGCHTWDHHNVTSYASTDWKLQLELPTKQLKIITGKNVNYFAYPNGIWNTEAIKQLKNNEYTVAFQLAGKQDSLDPAFTVRRIIADGHWSSSQLLHAIKTNFR